MKTKINISNIYTLETLAGSIKKSTGKNNPGIFLLGFSLEIKEFSTPTYPEKFLPYTLGKAIEGECIYNKSYGEIINLLGGNYPVFDFTKNPENIGIIHRNFQSRIQLNLKDKSFSTILPDPNFPHLLYHPEGLSSLSQFYTLDSLKTLREWMPKHITLFYITLENYDANALNELEKCIGNLVEYKRLIASALPSSSMEFEIIEGQKTIELKNYLDLFIINRGQMNIARFGL